MFANPTLEDGFLEQFLGLQNYWQVMQETARLAALSALAANSKMLWSRDSEKSVDGFSWHMAGKPLEQAWALIERLDPSDEVARHLAPLYTEMTPDTYKTEGTLAALQKWVATSEEAVAKEAKGNSTGWLSPHQQIRHAAARMLIAKFKATSEQFFYSEDVALRCAAYERGKLTVGQMAVSVEQDGALAVRHLIRNQSNWTNADHRDELQSLAQSVNEETLGWEYSHRCRLYLKEHPDWFDGEELPTVPEEKSLTDSSITDMVDGIVKGVLATPTVAALPAAFERLARAQRVQFWLLVAVIAYLLLHR